MFMRTIWNNMFKMQLDLRYAAKRGQEERRDPRPRQKQKEDRERFLVKVLLLLVMFFFLCAS